MNDNQPTTPVPGTTPAPQPAGTVAQPAPAVTAPTATTTPAPPQQASEWPEGDLPEQSGGGGRTALPPDIYTFRLPTELARQWKEGTHKDQRKTLSNGQPNPTFDQILSHITLKFDKDNPLVVEGGTQHGEPMLATFTTVPQPRPGWKRNDPLTPWIHDLAYVLEHCLLDTSRPTDPEMLKAAINHHAGGTIRLTIGRSGQCRDDRVRYIPQARVDPATGAAIPFAQGFDTVQDPAGVKGCGKRYYTKAYKGEGNVYQVSVQCDPNKVSGTPPTPGCGAMIRGFESVEGFQGPLAAAPAPA